MEDLLPGRREDDGGSRLTFAGVVLDGDAALGELGGLRSSRNVREGHVLGESVASLEFSHFTVGGGLYRLYSLYGQGPLVSDRSEMYGARSGISAAIASQFLFIFNQCAIHCPRRAIGEQRREVHRFSKQLAQEGPWMRSVRPGGVCLRGPEGGRRSIRTA